MKSGRYFVLLNENDNVATILDENKDINFLRNGMKIFEKIPFGHKVSITKIEIGEDIIKYGIKIGTAQKNIEKGYHVHIHNCQ